MKRLPLRSLVLGSVIATMIAGFTVFAIYIDRVEHANRIEDLDTELIRAERSGQRPTGDDQGPEGPPALPPSEESDVVEAPVQLLLNPAGSLIAASGGDSPFDQATLEQLIQSDGSRTVAEPEYRVRVTTGPDGNISVTALGLQNLRAATNRLRKALALGGAVIGVLVAALLWGLTGFLIRPVTRMTAAATKIASGELDTPVGEPGGSRETAELAADLDQMLTTLRTSLHDTQRSAATATAARDDMERFLADMAHELRTPLTALKGYSDLYAAGMLEDTPDVDRAMSRIGSESERLHNLVNQMLQLARANSADNPPEVFDVAVVLDEVTEDLRAAYPDQRFEIEQISPGHCNVRAIRPQIHQAILNLGSNACHHNPSTEPVVTRIHAEDHTVAISVIDHGPGIKEDDHDRIFLPFYRAEAARSRHGSSGAGLGLALTKQIADHHNANLVVTDTPGGGATFTLTLSLADPGVADDQIEI